MISNLNGGVNIITHIYFSFTLNYLYNKTIVSNLLFDACLKFYFLYYFAWTCEFVII